MSLNPRVTDLGNKIRLDWTPDLSGQGYRLYVDGVAVSRTFKPDAGSTTFAKPSSGSHQYGVRKMDVVGALEEATFPETSAPAYYVEDFSKIGNPPWESIHTFQSPGWQNPVVPVQALRDGRVSLVPAPDGVGKALRFEIRDSDPGWALDPTTARSQLQMTVNQTWDGPGFTPGEVRWFDQEWYLPLREFDYPSNDWFTLVGLHPNGAYNGWGCFDIGFDGQKAHPSYMTFKLAGGAPGSTQFLTYPRLWQLTNPDGSWYPPNFNRRIRITYGGKFAPDNTGWFEAWVDGLNVVPRMSHPTTWLNDYSTYFKVGPYKRKADPFPSGKTVIYCTKLTIGRERPF